jgi:hypothetical protein
MNIKVKTTLIIIITLIIGIVLGAMLNRTFMHLRIRRAFDAVNPIRFTRILEQAIDPTPGQKKQIREILKKHAKIVEELRKNFEEGMQSSFETLKKEMDSVLTPEQKERLEEMMRERRPWMRRERPPFPRRKGPFPDSPPKFPPFTPLFPSFC